MFAKGKKVYAEVGNYLRHKTKSVIGFTIVGDIEDFDEYPLNNPLDIVLEQDKFFFNSRMFVCRPSTMDYVGIKTKLITSRYSNDDQMALILNNGMSEDDTMLFNKMQEWRSFAGDIARSVVSLQNVKNIVD